MSYITYVRLFKEADAELREIQPQDALLTTTKPIENRAKGFAWLARHYLKYISIINKLGLCYDQMIDPLRLSIMKKLLDASVGRYMEIKSEMVREEVSDFHFLDGFIIEQKMTIHDAQIMVPRYYRNSRLEELNKMNETIDRVLHEIEHPKEEILEEEDEEGEGEGEGDEEEPKKEETVSKKKKEKRESAPIIIVPKVVELPPEKKELIAIISMIQRHERARTSRLIAQKVKEIKRVQDDIAWHRYVPIPADVLTKAVQNIQRFWRSYAVRLRLRAKDTRMRILIGELQSSYSITPQKMAIEHVEEMRRRLKKGAAEEWANAIINANERLLSAQQREDIGDELRYFILHWYRTIAELPEFPEDDMILPPPGLLGLPKGTPDDFIAKRCPPIIPIGPNMFVKGSALIVAGFWVAPELYELAFTAMTILKKQKAGSRPPPKLTKEQIKQLKLEAKEKALEQKKKLEEDIADKRSKGVYPVESKFLKEFKERLEESRLEWRVDEPINERAGLQVMKNVHFELRELVDDVMREELSRLQKALDIDRSKKTKEKKKKKPKKKKGKRVKDPTKNRTLESLFEELAGKGVIKKYPYVNLDDLFGDYGYAQSDLRGEPSFQDPWPKYGDLRQVVKEYCILNVMAPRFTAQLGPRGVNPAPIRSVLLFGPPHSGKRLLADGVCTQLGAVKFDLTPANLKGKVNDKKEKKMLVHMVSKVSRLLQPSVIFIDGGEKPFYGKVPKEEKDSNPRLLKADIPKLVKEIKPDDRIIFLATSNFPWLGNPRNMKKTYEKMLPVMRPDYGTIYNYLSKLLMAYHGVDRDFFTSSLARMSQRYPLTVLKEAVEAVLVPRRIVLLKNQPLSPMEIYEYLLSRKEEKLTPEEEQKYRDWWDKTYQMAINKKAKMVEDAEIRAKMAALKDAEKKKKK